jgi:hypothetical protein
MKIHCALAMADVLQPVPRFAHVRRSYSPEALREDFARMAGVEDAYVYEADIGKNRAWERSEQPAF